jgi:hypothetical protein
MDRLAFEMQQLQHDVLGAYALAGASVCASVRIMRVFWRAIFVK